ncbi:MAG: AI-2E family transporter, partial [Bdellovibrionales bacterium]|nr:AI-2E family transporter [Bdellovibrionales bacterium]
KSSGLLPPPWVLSMVAAGIFVWLLIQLKEIVVLLVVGFCIAYVLEPLLRKLEQRKIDRRLGLFIILFSAVLFGGLMLITAVPTILREYGELSSNFPKYVSEAKDQLLGLLEKFNLNDMVATGIASPMDALSGFGKAVLPKFGQVVTQVLMQGYSVTLTIVNATLLPFIVYYVALDFPSYHQRFVSLFPVIERSKVESILREINTYVAAFVRGQLSVCTVLFFLYTLGLAMVGVELWMLLGFIAGYGNMIPYLGFLIGIVLSSIMALVTFGDFSHVAAVWVVFAVVQALEGTVITPKILGDTVGLSPLIIILAIVAAGTLFGLLGIFLAVPGAAALRVLLRHGHEWVMERA